MCLKKFISIVNFASKLKCLNAIIDTFKEQGLFRNWRTDHPFVGTEIMFGSLKRGKLCNIIMHNFIWANQKTESFCVSLAMRSCNV